MRFGIQAWRERDYTYALTINTQIVRGLPVGSKTELEAVADWLNRILDGSNGQKVLEFLATLDREPNV